MTLPRQIPKQGLLKNWLFKVKILSRYILGHYCWLLLNVYCCVLGILKRTDIKSEDNALIHMPQAGVK